MYGFETTIVGAFFVRGGAKASALLSPQKDPSCQLFQ
jgi:hypothetical protein